MHILRSLVLPALFALTLALPSAARAQTGVWTTKTPMPTASYGLGAEFVNGKLYAISGFATNRVASFDPTAPQVTAWKTKAAMPGDAGKYALRQYFGHAAIGDKIYVVGGDTGGSGWLDTVLVYDTAADSWSNVAPMPGGARYALVAGAINGKLYAVGGTDGSVLGRNECYDPGTNTWTTVAPLPTPRAVYSGAVVNGKLYVLGGFNASGQGVQNVDIYDPVTNSWTTGADMPASRGTGTGVVEGKIYLPGGTADNTVAVYDTFTNSWGTEANIPTIRHDLGVAADAANRKVYAVGGYGSGTLATLEVLTPALPLATVTSVIQFGGAGDQRGTGVSIADGAVFLSASGVESQNSSDTSTLARYALPLTGTPAWSRTVGSGTILKGTAATTDGVFAAGQSYSLTTDSAGGKEVKPVLGRFPLDGSNGAGPEGSTWIAGSGGTVSQGAFFAYGGVESFQGGVTAAPGGGYYAVGAGQPASYGAYLVAKFDLSGNRLAAATDSTVGVSLSTVSAPAPGGSDARGVVATSTTVYVAGSTSWQFEGDSGGRPTLYIYDTSLSLQQRVRDSSMNGVFEAVTVIGTDVYAAGNRLTPGTSGSEDFLLEKFDAAGNRLWTKAFGGAATDILYDVIGVGSRVFAVGLTRSEGSGGADMVFFEFDPADGTVLSKTLWGGAQDDSANAVTTDGTALYVVGESKSYAAGGNTVGQNDAVLLRVALPSSPIAPVAPTVTTVAASGISSSGATLNGTVNPNGSSTTAYFEYGATTNYGSSTPVQNIPTGTALVNVSAPLSGLTSGATYHYRLVAGNAGGSAAGTDLSFVATGGGGGGTTAVPTATTGNATGVTAHEAMLAGTVNPNGGTTLVQFEYGLTTNYTNSTLAQDIGNGSSAVAVSASLSGLAPGSTYHYRVVGTNDLGPGSGTDHTFTTSVVNPTATTEAATAVGISFATLHGTVTPNDLAVTVNFELADSVDALGATATPVAASPGSLSAGLDTPQTVTANVTGLASGPSGTAKVYYYRTKATPVGGGAAVFGDPVSFSVSNSAPTPKDDTFVILGENTLNVLANDTDADPGDTASLRIVGDPTGAQLGVPVTSIDGLQITYTPGDLFPDDPAGDTFVYTVRDHVDGLTATATVRVISIRVFRGLYSGLIGVAGGGADAAGRLDIMVSPTGLVTGSFKWQGQPYTFKGANLAADGTLKVTKFKSGTSGPKLEIVLQLDAATKLLTGTLTDTSTVPYIVAQAEITGTASEIDPSQLPEPGTYNATVDTSGTAFTSPEPLAALRDTPPLVLPEGVGFSQVTVTKSAKRPARFVGRMPDDQKFSSGARALVRALRAAGGQPRYPLYTDSLYPKVRDDQGLARSGGVVSGDVDFTRATARFNSGLNWERRANPEAPRFGGGIRGLVATLNAIKYGLPAPGVLPAEIINDSRTVNAKVELRGGDLPAPPGLILHTLKMTRAGSGPVKTRVEPLNPANNVEHLSVKLNPSTGAFSGSFVHPNDAALSPPPLTHFTGVMQKQDGQGVFTGPVTTGRVYIVGQ